MKKIWFAVALAAVGVMATSVWADVQNIRLSGDVRVRGYYYNVGVSPYWISEGRYDNSLILQRTRVTCEADLEDHVLVVVTLKAEGIWGQGNRYTSYGTKMETDRGWQVGVTEAYVQFNEMFFSPATLKLGRQYLHYGKGFVISSANETYNFDAGRLVLDFYPLTIDLVGAKLADGIGNDSDIEVANERGGNNLLWVNARYEFKEQIIKAIEAYFGWVSNGGPPVWNYAAPDYHPIGWFGGYTSPWVVGIRGDFTPIKGLEVWAEGNYEGGTMGSGGEEISAWLANAGLKYTFKDVKMEPAINAEYIYASGYSSGYCPFFPSFIGNKGYLFAPMLYNIHIFNVGASVKPAKNVTCAVQGYYYLMDDPGGFAYSDWNQQEVYWDIYGYGKRELGWEIDAICTYDYSKDVRFQLVYAVFLPDRGVKYAMNTSAASHMVRGEVNVKF